MKSKFHPDAMIEFDEAGDFYDLRSKELGERYRSHIQSSIEEIEDSPYSWPMFDEDVRRHVVDDFPFVIIYLTLDDLVQIVAVMHTSRRPGYWKDRIN
jgi:plasmid stabilization system protein ParE